jgi:hypothetical protein
MKINEIATRAAFELTYQKPSAQRRKGWRWVQQLSHNVGQVGYWCVKVLAGNREPKISQHCDRHGNKYYKIYDPIYGDRYSCTTESEVRAWLEQRYSR